MNRERFIQQRGQNVRVADRVEVDPAGHTVPPVLGQVGIQSVVAVQVFAGVQQPVQVRVLIDHAREPLHSRRHLDEFQQPVPAVVAGVILELHSPGVGVVR